MVKNQTKIFSPQAANIYRLLLGGQVLTAKEINPKIKIIARANHIDIVDKLKSLGVANIVLPELLGAKEMVKSVLGY